MLAMGLAGLVGVALGFALAVLRQGAWVCLDSAHAIESCPDRSCQASTREGFAHLDEVRWRPFFRCAYCDARWLRAYLWAYMPDWLADRLHTHDLFDDGDGDGKPDWEPLRSVDRPDPPTKGSRSSGKT